MAKKRGPGLGTTSRRRVLGASLAGIGLAASAVGTVTIRRRRVQPPRNRFGALADRRGALVLASLTGLGAVGAVGARGIRTRRSWRNRIAIPTANLPDGKGLFQRRKRDLGLVTASLAGVGAVGAKKFRERQTTKESASSVA